MSQRGCLLIADIGGYTKFLTAVELEHSTDILSDLLGAIVAQAEGAFKLAKLEGDAVFVHAAEGTVDGPAFVTILESCYFAFAERLRDISRASSCDCGACRLTPSLHLKFVAHAGEYAIHTVAGNSELVGPEVIAVHRLLKNYVVEKTGKRGYAFMSQQLIDYFGLDPAEFGFTQHLEHYDDVGDIPGYVFDLEQAWQQHEAERRVFVAPEDSIFTLRETFPIAPAELWDWFASPAKMARWGADAMETTTKGARGVGTTNHCVHGANSILKQVVDWKPFHYMSEHQQKGPFGMVSTVELTPVEGGTVMEFRIKGEGNALQRAVFRKMAPPQLRKDFGAALVKLHAAIAEEQAGAAVSARAAEAEPAPV